MLCLYVTLPVSYWALVLCTVPSRHGHSWYLGAPSIDRTAVLWRASRTIQPHRTSWSEMDVPLQYSATTGGGGMRYDHLACASFTSQAHFFEPTARRAAITARQCAHHLTQACCYTQAHDAGESVRLRAADYDSKQRRLRPFPCTASRHLIATVLVSSIFRAYATTAALIRGLPSVTRSRNGTSYVCTSATVNAVEPENHRGFKDMKHRFLRTEGDHIRGRASVTTLHTFCVLPSGEWFFRSVCSQSTATGEGRSTQSPIHTARR